MNYAREETSKIMLSAIGDLWRFPIWWYSEGVRMMAKYCIERVSNTWERLAIGLFIKYFFKPMYGDYSWQGRIISLVMRFLLILYKSFRMIFWATWYLIIFILWIIILPLSIILIIW